MINKYMKQKLKFVSPLILRAVDSYLTYSILSLIN